MRWTIRLQDPSGEKRKFEFKQKVDAQESLTVAIVRAAPGHSPQEVIALRDATLPSYVGTITLRGPKRNEPWVQISNEAPAARLADIETRECAFPPGVRLKIGESSLVLEQPERELSLPEPPKGAAPWLTACESGRQTLWMTRKAAGTPLSVYLRGDTGTGKEVLAHMIHAWSARASGPFVPLNCAALPLSLAESELFGHVKGAFTGAERSRPGAFLQAHGGTLFLDEIGDLPQDIQVKLLRFLENGEIRPVGGDGRVHANVRLVCATHKDLEAQVEKGTFRRDLYYRIASVPIEIPALRDRAEDIELLARRFADALGREISPQAMQRLQSYDWPGNVRELRHAIERAVGMAGPLESLLREESFSFLLRAETLARRPQLELRAPILTLKEMERVLILKALRLSSGHRAKAAKLLGIARSTLFVKLRCHRINAPKRALLDWAA